ncbi:MAG TPA: hypothetical protein VLF89_10330 [Candidatus Saccharimonadales bacterium]|nr:hypothetical protein [Candidatus Saccharimonadales bacterium]
MLFCGIVGDENVLAVPSDLLTAIPFIKTVPLVIPIVLSHANASEYQNIPIDITVNA